MTEKTSLVLYGSGGHAKVLLDIAEKCGNYKIEGLFDDSKSAPDSVFGYPVLGGKDEFLNFSTTRPGLKVVVAIGNNEVRGKIAAWIKSQRIQLAKLIHPSAQIAREVTIGEGTVIMAGVVVNASTIIGENVIINTRSSVDHDCLVGDCSHLGPGTTLCGGVDIGAYTLVGVGAQIIPSIKVEKNVVIGAGSTVITDLSSGVTVVGTPATEI